MSYLLNRGIINKMPTTQKEYAIALQRGNKANAIKDFNWQGAMPMLQEQRQRDWEQNVMPQIENWFEQYRLEQMAQKPSRFGAPTAQPYQLPWQRPAEVQNTANWSDEQWKNYYEQRGQNPYQILNQAYGQGQYYGSPNTPAISGILE
jgi:hypothetical protein